MVIPEERDRDFNRKMQSPLFNEHFTKDQWKLVYFDAFRLAYAKTKQKTSLEKLAGEKKSPQISTVAHTYNSQLGLFDLGAAPAEKDETTMAVAEDPAEA